MVTRDATDVRVQRRPTTLWRTWDLSWPWPTCLPVRQPEPRRLVLAAVAVVRALALRAGRRQLLLPCCVVLVAGALPRHRCDGKPDALRCDVLSDHGCGFGAGADVSRPPAAVDAEATTVPHGRRGRVPPHGRLCRDWNRSLHDRAFSYCLRNLIAAYLRKHARDPAASSKGGDQHVLTNEAWAMAISSTSNIDEYCAQYVYPMGQDASDQVMQVPLRVQGCSLCSAGAGSGVRTRPAHPGKWPQGRGRTGRTHLGKRWAKPSHDAATKPCHKDEQQQTLGREEHHVLNRPWTSTVEGLFFLLLRLLLSPFSSASLSRYRNLSLSSSYP